MLRLAERFYLLMMILPLIICAGCGDTLAKRKVAADEVQALILDAKDHLKAETAVARLLQIAQSQYSFGATLAAGAFGKIGEAARPAVPVLARLMTSKDKFVASAAARSLAELGPISEAAIPQLEDRIHHEYEWDVVWHAAEALGNIGRPAIGSLPLLRERLAECDEDSRRRGGERSDGEILPKRLREAIKKLEAYE